MTDLMALVAIPSAYLTVLAPQVRAMGGYTITDEAIYDLFHLRHGPVCPECGGNKGHSKGACAQRRYRQRHKVAHPKQRKAS